MKKYVQLIIIILFAIVFIFAASTYKHYDILKEKYSKAIMNEKAYALDNDSLQNSIRALSLTIEELEYINNSNIEALNKARKELRLKDNQIKVLQNIQTEGIKTDTLILKDTIFIKEDFKIDTLLGDKWCSLDLTLEYPNKIGYDIKYTNDLDVFVYTEKETVEPPKQCWILRLFQKKHNITKVEVKDNNPYSNIKDQTFVIIE